MRFFGGGSALVSHGRSDVRVVARRAGGAAGGDGGGAAAWRGGVSYDCNYRPSLWKAAGGRQGSLDVNRSLAPYVDVLFGHEGDVAAHAGRGVAGSDRGMISESLRGDGRAGGWRSLPNIKVIATTTAAGEDGEPQRLGRVLLCEREGVP